MTNKKSDPVHALLNNLWCQVKQAQINDEGLLIHDLYLANHLRMARVQQVIDLVWNDNGRDGDHR